MLFTFYFFLLKNGSEKQREDLERKEKEYKDSKREYFKKC